MFQDFSARSDVAASAERVKRLRALLAAEGVDAVLIPRADAHQGEYVAPCAERLKWLTGFSGSAGLAAITRRHAGLFVDGRYTVQAARECDPGLFELPGLARTKLADWLKQRMKRGETIGFDPWLHSAAEIARLKAALADKGLKLKGLSRNPIDRLWGKERPPTPAGAIVPHPLKYAGRAADAKIADVQAKLAEAGQDAVILTMPDSVSWLLNIRGADIPHTPVVLAFAIVPAHGKPELFVAPEKLSREARAHIEPVAKISAPALLKTRIAALRKAGKRVRLDTERAAFWFARALGPKSCSAGADPCIPLKAIKNATEIRGARAAHVRDGAALARFLAWLDAKAAAGKVDEIAAVTRTRGDSRGNTGFEGDLLRYDIGDGRQRRDRSLSRDGGHQPAAESWRALSH